MVGVLIKMHPQLTSGLKSATADNRAVFDGISKGCTVWLSNVARSVTSIDIKDLGMNASSSLFTFSADNLYMPECLSVVNDAYYQPLPGSFKSS
jgi:hypothetical protein